MLKMILCVLFALLLGMLLLQMRRQKLELNYQANQLHWQIACEQSKLWNQQLQIATYTAPNAIAHTVAHQDLKLVPNKPLPPGMTHWIDGAASPDAE